MSLEIALERIQEAKETNATKLNLSGLGLKEIPSDISVLTQLIRLDLKINNITEIKGLENLTQLTRVYLSFNDITEIKGLENLTQLQSLHLSSNQLTGTKGLEKLSELDTLDLSSNKLTEIKGLESLSELDTLDLSSNKLTEIKGLENLIKLDTLNLSSNKLTEIKGLENLIGLRILDLGNNQLTEIKGLENLTQLQWLYLSNNQLTDTKGLENLIKLFYLFLEKNKLKEIRSIDELTNLFQLDLSYNRLTEMRGLEKLKKLRQLNFSHNQFSKISEYLLELAQPVCWDGRSYEYGIHVENNPFTNPPPEIIKQGNKAIEEYFNQRKRVGEELLNEAKLILLGDGRAGKTSLANLLLKKELPKEGDRTQGVDIVIGKYSFPLANGNDFKINIWDFAGQDKYKTLHQLFYTESSLYVMVAESGKTSTDYDDWFQTAQLFGEGSPLILILNEFKDGIGMGSLDVNYWKKQFPDLLKEVINVNLGSKKNFNAVEEYIRLYAQTLPHTNYAFPSNWAAIRRVLNERRDEQFITLKQYLQICKDNNLPERESALVLSSVLHKIGDCLHYQKSELLKHFIILKNEWATDAVYKVLDDKIVAEEKAGFFDRRDTERIWCSEDYMDMRPQLLELMKQFKLAYQLPGKDEYVTPPLLPTAAPEVFIWPDGNSLELYIEYEFLPKALLTQFIVTRHADIAEGRTLVWRHGVILAWEHEALAEVSKTKLQGRDAFHIRTQGSNRKEMMTVILKTFRQLHAEYKGIKYKEKVPCICNGCKTKRNDQHYFDFANLQFRLEKGRYEVECDKSLEIVNVLALLENSFVFEKSKEETVLLLKENVMRENAFEMRVVNLFLASSKELETEREKIEIMLSRKNDALRKQGFYIDLRVWEDGKYIGKSFRNQDDYNREIDECNLFAMLFYSKVGKYTLEEFDKAKSLFDNSAMPRLCIFQKNIDLPKNLSKEDSDSRYAFLERLHKLEHFTIKFETIDKLLNELEKAIDKLLQDKDFVKQVKVE